MGADNIVQTSADPTSWLLASRLSLRRKNLTDGVVAVTVDGEGNPRLLLRPDSLRFGPGGTSGTDLALKRTDGLFGPFLQVEDTPASRTADVLKGETVTVTTTDGTTTTLWTSQTLPASKTFLVEARVVARQGDTNRAGYVRQACVYRNSTGGAVLQGAVGAPFTEESNTAWNCTLDVSGNTVRVRVTGAAGATVDWTGQVRIMPS
jgi:hypothetical protein